MIMTEKILFTDTHFGARQNSMTWLKSQLDFIDKNLIPKIQKRKRDGNRVKLIHCGDVFDSRSAISPLVAKKVREKFIELAQLADEFIIIAGNHDFYSPNSDEIDTLSMVFRDCGIRLIIQEMYQDGEDLFIPWYVYKDEEVVFKYLDEHPEVKYIYTHADIFHEDYRNYGDRNVSVFSGHIHQPRLDYNRHWYNLGSCYSLDFADRNAIRHFYMLSGDQLQEFDNTVGIRFWRLYNEDIFNEDADFLYKDGDYFELYIEQINMQSPRYVERISELSAKYKNLYIIPQVKAEVSESEELKSYDIVEVCRSMIPDHLKDKFRMIEDNLS